MSLSHHAPILLVLIPLVAAPLCVLFKHRVLSYLLTQTAALITFGIAIALLGQVQEHGEISYAIGGWPAPWGIEYRIDTLNAYLLIIVTAIASILLPYARRSVEQEIEQRKQYLFYSALLLCFTGLLGIAVTGDAFNLFVFLEISSLSSYALISLGRDRRALTAAYRYLIMGTLGATFYLIGVGLLYMITGTLNMADLAERIPELADSRSVRTALAFLTVGIGLKLALFPLHLWLPNAYSYAPSVVSIFLAATATKVAIYVLIRFIYSIFGSDLVFETMGLDLLLLPLAIAAILSASIVAIFQDNLKRLLAYSSVAQIGYMVMGIAIASPLGLTAALIHLFNHALMKGALFMVLGAIYYRTGSVMVNQMAGIGRRMPLTMAAFLIGGLSLIGVPLTVGFISKWYLILAALEHDWWWLVVVILAGSLLSVVYIWRVVEIAYFHPPANTEMTRCEAPLSLLLPTWGLILANIYFGLDTSLTIDTASTAANILWTGIP